MNKYKERISSFLYNMLSLGIVIPLVPAFQLAEFSIFPKTF